MEDVAMNTRMKALAALVIGLSATGMGVGAIHAAAATSGAVVAANAITPADDGEGGGGNTTTCYSWYGNGPNGWGWHTICNGGGGGDD
jgi:hypothetical protein